MNKMSRLIGLFALLFGIHAVAQDDQPSAELFGGYPYLHSSFLGAGFNSHGGSASLAINPNSWLGIVSDFGGYHGSNQGVDLTTVTYLFGPRLSYRSKAPITPFVQALFGGVHESVGLSGASGSSNAFAMSVGGGLDLCADSHWSWRIVQAEYLLTTLNAGRDDRQNRARISTGVVYRWDW
jgi:hypothetical protein